MSTPNKDLLEMARSSTDIAEFKRKNPTVDAKELYDQSKAALVTEPSPEMRQLCLDYVNKYEGYSAQTQQNISNLKGDVRRKTDPYLWSPVTGMLPVISDGDFIPTEVRKAANDLHSDATREVQNALSGVPSPEKVQQVLEFVESISRGDIQREWFTEQEREILKPYFPTLRGIAGSVLVDAFTQGGYNLYFDEKGVIRVLAKAGSGVTDYREMQEKLNSEIARKPGFADILKAGMLYSGDSLKNYVRNISDTQGNPEPSKMSTNAYMDYLRGKAHRTPIEESILRSRKPFETIDFLSYANGTKYIDSLKGGAKQIMSSPQFQQTLTNLKQQGTKENYTTVVRNPDQKSPTQPKGAVDSFAYGLGTGAKATGEVFKNSFMGGMETVGQFLEGSGPVGVLALIAAFIYSWKEFGFFNTLLGGGGIMTALGLLKDPKGHYDKFKNTVAGNNQTSTNESVENQNTSVSKYNERFSAHINKHFRQDEIEKVSQTISKYKDVQIQQLNVWVRQNGKLPSELSQATEQEKIILKKYIQSLSEKEKGDGTIGHGYYFEVLLNTHSNLTLDDVNKRLFDLEYFAKNGLQVLQDRLAVEKDPAIRAEIQAAINKASQVVKNASSGKPLSQDEVGILQTLGIIAGTGVVGYILFLKIPGYVIRSIAKKGGGVVGEGARGFWDKWKKKDGHKADTHNTPEKDTTSATKDKVKSKLSPSAGVSAKELSFVQDMQELSTRLKGVEGVDTTKLDSLNNDIIDLHRLENKSSLTLNEASEKLKLQERIHTHIEDLSSNHQVRTKLSEYIDELKGKYRTVLNSGDAAAIEQADKKLTRVTELVDTMKARKIGILSRILKRIK